MEKIYLAGGCFWCIEAVFKRVKGVEKVTSGYAGGTLDNPNYEQVCQGNTGHTETVEVVFDSQKIELKEILDIFFKAHDPTSLNQQGADIGSQYRSAIFYVNQKQGEMIRKYIKNLEDENVFNKVIVTEVKKLNKFYKAEDYHQDYFDKNPNKAYCRIVIAPKLEKVFG